LLRFKFGSRLSAAGRVALLAGLLVACYGATSASTLGRAFHPSHDPGTHAAGSTLDGGLILRAALARTLPEATVGPSPSLPDPAPQTSTTASSGDPNGAPGGESARLGVSFGPAPKPRSFVVLGDSLSVWAFAPGRTKTSKTGAWPGLLAAEDSDIWLVHNAAVPGNTTAQMLGRLRKDVLAYHPDILFVMGGTNDVGYGLSGSITVTNIRRIVETAKSQGIEVILLTIPPNNDIPCRSVPKLRKTNSALKALGIAEGIEVIDVYAALATPSGRLPAAYAAADHLHLTLRGEAVVAATVYSALNDTRELGPAS
jgi:lysophospholipase L1-like esterase